MNEILFSSFANHPEAGSVSQPATINDIHTSDYCANPLLERSELPFEAPRFDLIRKEHYLPAFKEAIALARAEVDAIAQDDAPPNFENTVLALEKSGELLDRVSGIFFNLLEAESDEEMQQIAEEVSPLLTEHEMYVSHNERLFARIDAIYRRFAEETGSGVAAECETLRSTRETAVAACENAVRPMEGDSRRLLEKTWKAFVRNGALLPPEEKLRFEKMSEELSLLELQYGKHVLDATNAFQLHIIDAEELEGLPEYLIKDARQSAGAKGLDGWVFDLSAPMYRPFMKFSARRDLREKLWRAYNSRAFGGANRTAPVMEPTTSKTASIHEVPTGSTNAKAAAESQEKASESSDNSALCLRIVELRREMARMLGYACYADYATEDRMVGGTANVRAFLEELLKPSLPAARAEVAEVQWFALVNGFIPTPTDTSGAASGTSGASSNVGGSGTTSGTALMPWDFAYWAERLRAEKFSLSEDMLKPYFRLENCIDAVFGLATTLYGLQFELRPDIPAYHPDVRVYEVKDADGRHLALFYADFFPREGKRPGAWMTEFRGQSRLDGVDKRPFISIVTNFSKASDDAPSLLTHDELTTFLHEFGHSLHGILSDGRYPSLTCTNVDHDFVELPSQIMENWGFRREFLKTFARHYRSGELIPDELIDRIWASRNYLAAFYQIRQLRFGFLDLAWHTVGAASNDIPAFENAVLKSMDLLPAIDGTCISTAFSHIFSGGYSAGYYSYKWAEVLEADAFSLFEQKGIFNREVAGSFRECILSKGSSEDERVLYRRFRGHDPRPSALLEKLGIIGHK